MNPRFSFLFLLLLSITGCGSESPEPEVEFAWTRHTIDSTSQGADGVRLGDLNRDGRPDLVTGWEEGGLVRVYLHPGPDQVREPWPHVTVGEVGAVEDAAFADLDGDGTLDVVSAAEGDVQALFVHWAPSDSALLLDPEAWATERFPATDGQMQWMFTLPDGHTWWRTFPTRERTVAIVAGAKGEGAQVGWLTAPENPRDLDAWTWQTASEAGWIMTLHEEDMDLDGDLDLVLSDRRGPLRGLRWIENPHPNPPDSTTLTQHFIGGRDQEVMFMTLADLDQDGLLDALAATASDILLAFRRLDATGRNWETHTIRLPEIAGTGKAVAVADMNGDYRPDIVFSTENAQDKDGLMWLSPTGSSPWTEPWTSHPISGPEGTKFDLVQLIDLDNDGDLDVLTCEEAEGLGVVWYESDGVGRP